MFKGFLDVSSFWVDRIHPEDRQRILAQLPRIFEEEYHTYNLRFLCKNGAYIWVRDEVKPVFDKEEKPLDIYFV
jgi:PAS domain S-box-containing protein